MDNKDVYNDTAATLYNFELIHKFCIELVVLNFSENYSFLISN